MNDESSIYILPYTRVVGQEGLKLALEISYIAPRIGGVLISGERGTGKSTVVRAFARMMHGHLPVTIPINATEDRVIGGWQISELVHGQAVELPGLLEDANGKLLYIDEVNLLDDHIVNLILDVTSTGVLVVQREGLHKLGVPVQFTLVGTMNPEEGNLRPQLLDRFGLMVKVTTETNSELRSKILQTVLEFDAAIFQKERHQPDPQDFFGRATKDDDHYRKQLEEAKNSLYNIEIPHSLTELCVKLAQEFQAEGHRGDHLLVLASLACAARQKHTRVMREDIESIVPLVLQHRRSGTEQLNRELWSNEDEERLIGILKEYE